MKKALEFLKKHKKPTVTITLAIALYFIAKGLGIEIGIDTLTNLDLTTMCDAIENAN